MNALRLVLPSLLLCIGCRAEPLPPGLPAAGLVLDLDAARGHAPVNGLVAAWTNQAPGTAHAFVTRRPDGAPALRPAVPELGGKPALVFDKKELVCLDEDAFDALTTGGGHTWLAVVAVHDQRPGLKDVNSIFGNLRNKGNFEGLWANLNDDNSLWSGSRNGRSFGRFNADNPKVQGPVLAKGRFHLIAGRQGAGTGTVTLELFANGPRPAATAPFPVNPQANASKLAIGQERDATEHPGHEAFVGEIARVLMWSRPLSDAELAAAMADLQARYALP